MAKRVISKSKKGGFDLVTGIGLVISIFLIYLIVKRIVKISKQGKTDSPDLPIIPPSENPNPTGNNTPNAALDVDKWLKKGSTGKEVSELQKMMNADIDKINIGRGKSYAGTFVPKYEKLKVDGIFGTKTEAALLEISTLNLGAGKGVKQASIRRYKEIVAMNNAI